MNFLSEPNRKKLMPAIRVSDHLRLAYAFAAPYAKPHEAVEDTEQYSECLQGLWDAARIYDGRNEFSTLAYQCMENRVREGHRNRNRLKCHVADAVPHEVLDTVEWENNEPKFTTDLVKKLLAPHPDDNFFQKRNKKILGQHFLKGWSWAMIARRNKISRAAAQQAGFSAMRQIRQQHCELVED